MGALRVLHANEIHDEAEHEYDADFRRRTVDTTVPKVSPVNQFAMVPFAIFGLVDPGAVCVYGAIAQFTRPDGYASVSVDVLVRLIRRVSKPTVMKHIQALSDAGLVVITERKRGSTRSFEYFLPMHPPVKKLDRSDNNAGSTGQESLPVTGQKTLPVDKSSGKESLPVPVKKLDHQHKEGNDNVNSSLADGGDDTPDDRTIEIMTWYTTRIRGVVPVKESREWTDARHLGLTSATTGDLDELFDWLSGQRWVQSISLALMAKKYNEWLSSKQTKPKQIPHNSHKSTKPVF